MQHRPVADAGDGAWVRRIEQSLQLVTYEIANKRLIGFLHRNRMNPARLIEAGRNPVFEEAEERVDRGEPSVAGSHRVTALLLQMLQEGQDQRCIEPLDLYRRSIRYLSSACRTVACSGRRRLFWNLVSRITSPSAVTSSSCSAKASAIRMPVAAIRPSSVVYRIGLIEPGGSSVAAVRSKRTISSER